MFGIDKQSSARVEIRTPDAACNPYLAYAVLLRAGLAGIEGEYELPDEADNDVWALSPRQRMAMGIEQLPHNLDEAVQAMENSELVADTLGEHLFEHFLANKRAEFEDYRAQVTPFELQRYLPVL